MDTYWKKMFFVFVLIQAGITLAMGIIGILFLKGKEAPYLAFFFPFLFAAFCMVPELVFYSKKEPGIRQLMIQKIVKLILREIIVLGAQKALAPTTSLKLMVALGVAVAVIAVVIQVIGWIYEKEETGQMNRKLQAYHSRD